MNVPPQGIWPGDPGIVGTSHAPNLGQRKYVSREDATHARCPLTGVIVAKEPSCSRNWNRGKGAKNMMKTLGSSANLKSMLKDFFTVCERAEYREFDIERGKRDKRPSFV